MNTKLRRNYIFNINTKTKKRKMKKKFDEKQNQKI